MFYAKRENRIEPISEYDIDKFKTLGYKIYDIKGKELREPTNEERLIKNLQEEVKGLKSEIKKLKQGSKSVKQPKGK